MSVKFVFNLKKSVKSPVIETSFYLKSQGGPTLILSHGLTGTPREMKFLGNFFHMRGYSVVCPRLANHGEPIDILKYTKWEAFYESIRKAFLELDTEGPVHVAGLSMGALLVLLLAEEFPKRIAGVSCLSPTLFYDGWNVSRSRFLLPLAYYTPIRHVAYYKEEPPYGIKNEKNRRWVHKAYEKADLNFREVDKYGYPYFPATLFCELRRLIKHIKKVLPHITVPVQMLQAEEDDMTSVKNSQFIYERISSTVKEIVMLHNSYHVITADQERKTVALKMELFFSRLQNLSGVQAIESPTLVKKMAAL